MTTTTDTEPALVVIVPHEHDTRDWGYIHRATCWHVGRDQGAAHPYPRRPTTVAECRAHPEWTRAGCCKPGV
jgi:hypothetical protein